MWVVLWVVGGVNGKRMERTQTRGKFLSVFPDGNYICEILG